MISRRRLQGGAGRRPAVSKGEFRRVPKGVSARLAKVFGRVSARSSEGFGACSETNGPRFQRRFLQGPREGFLIRRDKDVSGRFFLSVFRSSFHSSSRLELQLPASGSSPASRFGSCVSFKAPATLPFPTGLQASSYDHREIFEKNVATILELET